MSGRRHDARALQALAEQAAPDLEMAFRPMFGGIMGYAHGKPFASLSTVGLALKLVGQDRAEFLAMPGAAPLRYKPDDPPSRQYVLAPETVLADRAALASWLRRSASTVKGKA